MRYTPEQVIEGLKHKDPEILRHMYRAYSPMIVRHVRKNSGSEEDAQEMIQVTILECWSAVVNGRYEDQGKLDHYVYKVCANCWREELRRRRNKPKDSLEDKAYGLKDSSDESLAQAIVKDRYLEAIQEGLQHLDSPCDDIIRMYHLENIQLQEVAVRMQYDYNNLRKRIFDCRKKLKTIVDKLVGSVEDAEALLT
mgnify:CR=1 FL=1